MENQNILPYLPLHQLSPKKFAAFAEYLSESLFSITQQNDAFYVEKWLKVFQSYFHVFQLTKRNKTASTILLLFSSLA